jgi:hypothetical protein
MDILDKIARISVVANRVVKKNCHGGAMAWRQGVSDFLDGVKNMALPWCNLSQNSFAIFERISCSV